MKLIKSFFSKIRYKLFVCFIEWEIYHSVFPHLLNNKTNKKYPFSSDEELLKTNIQFGFDAQHFLETINCRAEKMHKAYGEAFLFIMYRDLHRHMKMFECLIEHRTYPPLLNPLFCQKKA